MPSIVSPSLRLELQATGENLNAWGAKLNDLFMAVEQAIASVYSLTITGSRELSADNYVANEYRRGAHYLTAGGGLAAAFTITVPPVSFIYTVTNLTTFPATYKTASGVGAVIRPGMTSRVLCDGTDCRVVDPTLDQIKPPVANVAMNGNTFTGLSAPTASDQPSTKGYVDALRGYVDTKPLSSFGAPTANIAFGGYKFTGLADGAAGTQDSATVKQVENLINASTGQTFPVQSGHAGEFLTTNGTVASFEPVERRTDVSDFFVAGF